MRMGCVLVGLVLFLCAMPMPGVLGERFVVGGSMGWAVPPNSNQSFYGDWVMKHKYHAGDILVFKYSPDKDNVMQVNRESFESCQAANAIESHSDGKTLFKLKQSGPYWFISGTADHCQKGQKFGIMVLPEENNSTSPSAPGSAPSLAPVQSQPAPLIGGHSTAASAPAPAPTSHASSLHFHAIFSLLALGLASVLL